MFLGQLNISEKKFIKMEGTDFNCITWNVNSLSKRSTDVHAYLLANDIDVMVLQEVGIKGINFQLSGYRTFELHADETNNTRGLITFIKNCIPATLGVSSKVNGTEFLCVNVHLKDTVICVANIYVHADKLNVEDLPSCVLDENCLLMGDLNARHYNLGTKGTPNRNGYILNNILESIDTVRVLGNGGPTHVRGGRIDYAILFNMIECRANAVVVGNLLSDHFAINVSLNIEKMVFNKGRKRYKLKNERKVEFIERIDEWYKAYKSINGHNNDENVFYEDLLNVIDGILNTPREPGNKISHYNKSRYVDDKIVKGWSRLLRKSQSRWSKNPCDEQSKETMVQIAECTTEVRKVARGKYWNNFLKDISFTKSLGGVWNEVNKVRGIKRKVVSHPDPKGNANDLMRKWAAASSFSGLPNNVQACLRNRRFKRRRLVSMQSAMTDESCVPFTENELLNAVKKGKSTAPGEDGLTYEVLNCLITMKNSPLLDLFNLSYENGRLPIKWKIALIVPVPKGNGEYRPISLTSCLCKMMERLILNRLLFVIGDQLSHNLYGFIKGKSTSDCVIKVLSNPDVKCRAFVDLKGAFDRANGDVILEELVNKGVRGKLLRWLDGYLSNRKAKVWCQGCESDEMSMELGTPQGGVLSPMLFNILMDKIARHSFPKGTQIIIYADDIVIQCVDENTMKNALAELQNLCLHMGLIVNENKSKFQSRMIQSGCTFVLNGTELEKVSSYKYLGMYICFNKSIDEINHVRNVCTARLNPLRVLANKGNGAGIPVLRMVYISTIRSVIDYAAPLLISYAESELRPLEVIQNKAMRIILGCPRSTRIEIMRLELHLPSIVYRIQELATIAAVRMIRRGEKGLKRVIDKIAGDNSVPVRANSYLRKLGNVMLKYEVVGYCVELPRNAITKPWLSCKLSVEISKLDFKKREWNTHELKQLFLSKINTLPRSNSIHIYCDGSVNGVRAGCGAVIREYFDKGISTDDTLSKRVEDKSSSTTTELNAIYEGLKMVSYKKKDVFIFSDSQSALLSLNSNNTMNSDLVAQCKNIVYQIQGFGCKVIFYWIPSHIGIYLNEVADRLAKEATDKTVIDTENVISIKRIKRGIRLKRNEWETENIRKILENGSESMEHYLYVLENTNITYGKALSKADTMTMRIRLGYKYIWEYTEGNGIPCKLCHEPSSHTLHHYITECYELSEFRNLDIVDFSEQVCYFLNNAMVQKKIQEI